MSVPKTTIVSAAVIFLTFLLYFFLRSIPVAQIWKSYNVVYVENTVDEETVLRYLSESGCSGVISLGSQTVPFVSDITPVVPGSVNSYLTERLAYFTDYSNQYRLFYVPKSSGSQAVRALENLSRERDAVSGIDGKQQYPWLVFVITACVFLFFSFISKNSRAFMVSSVFVVFLSASQPFYPVAAASVLYMLSSYLAQQVWNRKKARHVLSRNLYFLIPLSISIIIFSIVTWQCAVLMVFTLASSYFAVRLLLDLEAFIESKRPFKFVKIFSACQIKIMYDRTAFHTLVCLVPLIVILAAFLLSARFAPAGDTSITLPLPVDESMVKDSSIHSKACLPVMKDYYRWVWNIKTFPYRSLNESSDLSSVEDGDCVEILRYESTEEGIKTSSSKVFTYDAEFRKVCDTEIDGLGEGAIETFLKKQENGIAVVYGNKGKSSGQTDSVSLVLILLCLLGPVVLLLIYSLSKKGISKSEGN